MRSAILPKLFLLGLGVALAVIGLEAPVWAESSGPARAEELIKKANDLRRQGNAPQALPLVQQAYEIARTPRTAAQLGLVEAALGYWLPAHDHLTEALNPAIHQRWIDENRDALEAMLKNTASHLVNVDVEGKPVGAEVLVNSRTVGTLPLRAPLKFGEGRIELEVRAAGYRPLTRILNLPGGASEHVPVRLEPAAGSPAAVASAQPTAQPAVSLVAREETRPLTTTVGLPTWRRTLPWLFLAAGVGAASIAVWQHVAWRNSQGTFESISACGAGAPMRGQDSRCQGLYDELTGHRANAFVAYGVTGILGAGATAVFILNSKTGSNREAAEGVAPGPGKFGLTYRMSF